MAEITAYAAEVVDRTKSFEYDDLYDAEDVLGDCPACGRPVIEMAWFYRCREQPDVSREDGCPMRFWKDTSGRYLDRQTVRVLLSDGKTGPLNGFTARNGRTYRGYIELDRESWQLKVRSLGYNEGEGVSDQPEYEVNPEPLGRCPFDEDCQVLESPTQFVCECTLKREEAGADPQGPKGCGFVLPRTVCKREISREEAEIYLRAGRTELLSDFTSRFGRPFAATLVLKKNGRHGFEFQPREGRSRASAGSKKAARKKKGLKGPKTTTRKNTGRKASRKTASTRKKATAKKTTTRKKSQRKKSPRKKSASRTRGDD